MMAVKNSKDNYRHPIADVIYVEGNIPGPGIDLDEFESEFAIGCACESTCLPNQCSCIRRTANYIDNLLIISENSGPIMECNSRCICSENCGNRLVQKGPLNCLTVLESGTKGLGLFSTGFIKKNQFICEYAGESIDIDEARRRYEENNCSMNYIIVVAEYFGDKRFISCIDPKYFGNIGRYCNHSCEPNTRLVPVRVQNNLPRICLFASKDIHSGDEITFNYAEGTNNFDNNLSDTPCLCGSSSCRHYLPHHSV